MTTTSSTLKMAAVLAIWPAIAVASSMVWAFSMTDPGTATDRVGSSLEELLFAAEAALLEVAAVSPSRIFAAFLQRLLISNFCSDIIV